MRQPGRTVIYFSMCATVAQKIEQFFEHLLVWISSRVVEECDKIFASVLSATTNLVVGGAATMESPLTQTVYCDVQQGGGLRTGVPEFTIDK